MTAFYVITSKIRKIRKKCDFIHMYQGHYMLIKTRFNTWNFYKTGNVCIMQHWDAFVQSLLLLKRIQHAMRMRNIVMCSTWFYNTILISWMTQYSKKVIEHKMCLLILSTTSVWNVRTERNMINMYTDFHV